MARCQGTVESLCQGLLDLDDDKFGAMCSAFGYLQEWPDLGAMCGASLGATPGAVAPGAGDGDGNDDSSCSGSGGGGGGGFRKRRREACLDAKVRDFCVRGGAVLCRRCALLPCKFSWRSSTDVWRKLTLAG